MPFLSTISISPTEEEICIFRSLDTNQDGLVSKNTIEHILRLSGINPKQSQLKETFKLLDAIPKEQQNSINIKQFSKCIRPNISLFARANRGELIIPDFHLFAKEIRKIYEICGKDTSGANADYIPELRDANPDRYALSIVTVDGQQLHLGDYDQPFSAQSTCKTINYCLAIEQNGLEIVHNHVGREPSGRVFNELTLNSAGLPHNPMINAGAIMTTSLVNRGQPVDNRFEQVRQVWERLAGGTSVGFDAAVCKSEAATAHRNWALAHYMMENKAFPVGTDLGETLDFYFRTCSLSVNCSQMAMLASTLANGGTNPITNERIFQSLTVQACLSLMNSCGMYNFSGEWAFRVGLPAKSGVSGAVIMVVPNVMGICIWSPRLDDCGNSVRGINFAKTLVDRFSIHSFDSIDLHSRKINPLVSRIQAESQEKATLIEASSNGDLMAVQHLLSVGADPSAGDYDGRTPLHLACSEGHLETVRYLLKHGANPEAKDRWNQTPLDDAIYFGNEQVIELLNQYLETPVESKESNAPITREKIILNNPVTSDLIAFIWASSIGDLTSLRRFIARGIDPNHRDYDGRTALHLSASEGHNGVLRFLLAYGARTDHRDRWGNTALDDAKREGHASTVNLLVRSDDDDLLKDKTIQ